VYNASIPPIIGAAMPFIPQAKYAFAKRNEAKINSWNIFHRMSYDISHFQAFANAITGFAHPISSPDSGIFWRSQMSLSASWFRHSFFHSFFPWPSFPHVRVRTCNYIFERHSLVSAIYNCIAFQSIFFGKISNKVPLPINNNPSSSRLISVLFSLRSSAE
jgi:hypothetical protein